MKLIFIYLINCTICPHRLTQIMSAELEQFVHFERKCSFPLVFWKDLVPAESRLIIFLTNYHWLLLYCEGRVDPRFAHRQEDGLNTGLRHGLPQIIIYAALPFFLFALTSKAFRGLLSIISGRDILVCIPFNLAFW